MRHTNNGNCDKCRQIFGKYPEFYEPLEKWFLEFQTRHPEAHISCAGRGKADQEHFFKQGTTKAHWKESPHNYNAAIDIFKLHDTGAEWPVQWYQEVVIPEAVTVGFEAGGLWPRFKDWPHFEVGDWAQLAREGVIKLVELDNPS